MAVPSLPFSMSDINAEFGTKSLAQHFSDGDGGVGALPGNMTEFEGTAAPSWTTGADVTFTGEAYGVTVTSTSRTANVTNGPINITVSGHATALMSVGGGAFLSGTQSVSNGQSIRLRLTTANDPFTERIATASGNGDTLNFSVTTGDFG